MVTATDRSFLLQRPFLYSEQVHNKPVVLLKVGFDQFILVTVNKVPLDLNGQSFFSDTLNL